MSNFKEVLFISDESDAASSIHCYDLRLGVRVMMYKGGSGATRGSLNIINEEYLMSAEVSKPFLHVWALNKEEQVKRIGMPGKVSALAVSDNGVYCAAGIDNKIYVWNIASGQLLNVIGYHHEPITKILFWNCNYFISSGADGLVAVWRLVDVTSKETGNAFGTASLNHVTPFFSSSRHSLPVTDMFLAPGGSTCRLFTVSADQTCHIFSLGPDSGKFLIALTYDFVLTSVLCDRLQKMLYVGTSQGKIILFPMEPSPNLNLRHIDDGNSLLGHSEAVKTLALSQEDNVLASGSEDKKVILWNVSTKQQMQTYQMHASVSDIFFHVVGSDFLLTRLSPKTIISNFERTLLSDPENMEIKVHVTNEIINEDEVSAFEDMVMYPQNSKRNAHGNKFWGPGEEQNFDFVNGSLTLMDTGSFSEEELNGDGTTTGVDCNQTEVLKREVSKLKLINSRLKRINKRLYTFGLNQIWQNRNVRNAGTLPGEQQPRRVSYASVSECDLSDQDKI